MIELEIRRLAGNEILHACPRGRATEPLPCVVFYHGFTSSKEVYSYFAVALALAGMRVIMPDAAEHGARFAGDEAGRWRRLWPILLQNFSEFPALDAAIRQQGWVSEGRLAVAGVSMGGMTTLGIMARNPQVRCAASLMGSGYFSTLSHSLYPSTPACDAALADWDVSRRLLSLGDRPLLLWHGEDDDVLPAAESFRLQQALREAGLDSRLTCRWQAGVNHRITPEALACTVEFFRRHL